MEDTAMGELICLGDSMVFGYGVDRTQRWTTLIDGAYGWHVFNRGANAERTDQILKRFPRQVLCRTPDALFVLGGSNDLFQGRPVSSAIDNLRTIIESAKEKNIRVFLADVLPYIYPFDPPCWASAVDFADVIPKRLVLNEQIRSLAKETGSTLVELSLPMEALAEDVLRTMYVDELHCNAAGHRFIADLIAGYLQLYPGSDLQDVF